MKKHFYLNDLRLDVVPLSTLCSKRNANRSHLGLCLSLSLSHHPAGGERL